MIQNNFYFNRNSSKLETVSCSHGLQTITTSWKIYNPSLFTYWRKHENTILNENSSFDKNAISCFATESKQGLAILKNSFVGVIITFSKHQNNKESSVWVSDAKVSDVGQYISLVHHFISDKNKLKTNSLKNWIQKIALKRDFTSHVLRALLMGINHCLPNSFKEDDDI